MVTGYPLIIILLVGIAFIVVSTAKFKLHPFIALLLGAYGIGLAANISLGELTDVITKGFGNIMAYIGIVIVLGTMIGIILEKSGAAVKIADVVIRIVGEKRPVLAMNIIGMIVSIPVFCDSGFVILSALKKSITIKTKASAVAMTVALATGLFATHTLVPPTPGPIAAAGNLKIDNIGLVVLVGLFVSVFAGLAGYFWAVFIAKRTTFEPDYLTDIDLATNEDVIAKYGKLPSALAAFAPILVPIILMGISSAITMVNKDTTIFVLKILIGLGKPLNALLIGLFCATALIPKWNEETLYEWANKGVVSAGGILIITGAGGALGAVLKATEIGTFLGETLKNYELGIFVPFIIAAALKTAQGSSTTALVVTSSIIYPLLKSLGLDSQIGSVLAVMSIGAGAMTVSHANDSFFWVVSQFSKMDVKTAYRTFTTATLVQGIVTMIVVYLMSLVLL